MQSSMQAALLPDRGIVKVAGDDARKFLNGLVTADVDKATPTQPVFAALLTPQGKIITDFIMVEAPLEDGGGFFLDVPRALAPALVMRLGFYRLRARITVEDLSATLGVMALWNGTATTEYGLCYPDPRLPALGLRCALPPAVARDAAADLGTELVDAAQYEAHRIGLGVPRGGVDFMYGDAFPHETDMDQLAGIDFKKGCYVGQEVVSRVEHRGTARSRVVPVTFEGGAPETGLPVLAGDKQIGNIGSTANGRGLAMLRLDRVTDAMVAGIPITAGGIALTLVKPDWVRFAWPGETAA
jgi:folate-binding protein YgfZ